MYDAKNFIFILNANLSVSKKWFERIWMSFCIRFYNSLGFLEYMTFYEHISVVFKFFKDNVAVSTALIIFCYTNL